MFDSLPDQEPEDTLLRSNASALPEESMSVLVVDDHAIIRAAFHQALAHLPEIKRVMMVQNYVEAEKQAAQLSPAIIWLDLRIGDANSIAEIGRLRKLSATSRIIALADEEDEQQAFEAIMAGAQGYCSKQDIDAGEIKAMIEMLSRGEFVLRPRLLTSLMQRLRAAAMPLWGSESGSGNHPLVRKADFKGLAALTTREREILQLISQGIRDRNIAKELHISEKTVQKYVQSILSKLGVQNRTEAAYLMHLRAPTRDTSDD